MNPTDFLASLNLFTLIAFLAIAGAMLAYFLRKKSNRRPMDTPEGKAADEMHRREAKNERADEGRASLSPEAERKEARSGPVDDARPAGEAGRPVEVTHRPR